MPGEGLPAEVAEVIETELAGLSLAGSRGGGLVQGALHRVARLAFAGGMSRAGFRADSPVTSRG